jgi:ribosomal protein S18 acetylase RimI-like enzyme
MPEIRLIQENDWEQFQKLEKDCFPNELIDSLAFKTSIATNGFFGIFNDQNILVGYLYCRNYSSYGHLHRIGVLANERGKGYGSQLFKHAIDFFEKSKNPEFALFVETKNENAIKLYQKFGMQVIYESWHFIIEIQHHNKVKKGLLPNVLLREITLDDFNNFKLENPDLDLNEYSGILEEEQKYKSNNFMLALVQNKSVKLITRFNKNFSGCRPLFCSDITYFDNFIDELVKLKDSNLDYVRITFDGDLKLSKLCYDRNYKLHHHLFKMKKI